MKNDLCVHCFLMNKLAASDQTHNLMFNFTAKKKYHTAVF